ncbi:hypothetical protein [Neobacillus kokaensis]|uniref:YqgU-like 6-bladed beta-propeller domain-containing protein n=1 Tax=Neobacillus kokaensis TaxID=2759023 RepID=A0ABQ3MZD4_9BACI|nr:hypothetical protein [Neobacillus kokaensis]GHH96975.1 hypothetical protein AM1BK_05180 [Neobacillus kokaensis]
MLTIILILFTQIVSACAHREQLKVKIPAGNNKPKDTSPANVSEWKLPISIPEGEFYKSAGWLSESKILFITNLQQTSNVYRYDLLLGKSELIYHSDHPIVTLQISPSKKYFLIHSAPSSYEGVITVIDTNGKEKLKKSIASYELAFEWNPFDESQILISKFEEDWTFQVLLMNLKKFTTMDVSIPQPFIKWMAAKQIAFLNWEYDHPALDAPLTKKDLEDGKETTLFKNVTQFAAFKDVLMTVTINEEDQSHANYSFYNRTLKEIFKFSIPQLTNYSDWLIPFFDYTDTTGHFITFQPINSGEADTYREGFNLVEYDLRKGMHQTIMDGLENEPITVSPSGKAILYGNSFEQIIDLHEKKIYQIAAE